MTNKNIFTMLVIFAVFLMNLGMVSAVSLNNITTYTIPSTTTHNATSFDILFNLVNTGAPGTLNFSGSTITTGTATITFNDTSIANGTSSAVTERIKATITFGKYQTGTIAGIIDVIGQSASTHRNFTFSTAINSTPELTITSIANLTKIKNGTVKVQNTGNVNLTGISITTTTSADFDVQFNTSNFALTAGQAILVNISSTDVDDLTFRDDNSLNMRATNGTLNSNTITLTVPNFFYDGDNEGELDISIDRVDVKNGFGEDEDYWYPFDDIELKVTIENDGEWDVENIELQLCLLDVTKNKCVLDEGDMELEEDGFDIDEGDDNSVLINFNIDPSVLKEGNTDYTLYVSAVGKVDDSDSDYDDDDTGKSTYMEIEIRTEEEFIIFDQATLADSSNNEGETSCGKEVTLSANVWNIGDKDLDNDEIFVLVYNKELKISEVVSFNNGINAMDWELMETTFTIPTDANEKTYIIELTAYDDEDIGDNDVYENKEDDKAEFFKSLKVVSCETSVTKPTVNANLESEAKTGEELIINTIITNNGENNDFIISLSDFEDWATLVSVTPQTASINEGEFAEVTIILKPTTAGKHSFNINTIVDGETYDQPVSVNIAGEESENGIFSKISNTTLYIITGIVTLLIVMALVLIVRISRRRTKPEF